LYKEELPEIEDFIKKMEIDGNNGNLMSKNYIVDDNEKLDKDKDKILILADWLKKDLWRNDRW